MSMIPYRLKQRQQVRHRNQSLDIMDGTENEASARAKSLKTFANLLADVVGCAEWQCLLRVNSSPPKRDSITKFVFQFTGVHVGRRALERVQNVKPCGNKIVNQRRDRTARMDKRLPRGVFVYPLVDLLVEREEQIPVGFG